MAQLTDWGLDGVECHYPLHDTDMPAASLAVARKYDLAVTGGSDFHGAAKPDTALGSGRGGNLRLGYELLAGLKARLRGDGQLSSNHSRPSRTTLASK